ncbi:MAG: alpha/beta hydrolase, partial [Rhodocyclaceae bacterium]|nr:alpha/beta hydrolase [Rhodocyclaceae bacterium]
SDLLSHETCLEMGKRGPKALVTEIPGVGHAPMFMDDAQVAVVKEFLLTK